MAALSNPSQVDFFMKVFIAACLASVFALSWLLRRREEVAVAPLQPSSRAVSVELTNEQVLREKLIESITDPDGTCRAVAKAVG